MNNKKLTVQILVPIILVTLLNFLLPIGFSAFFMICAIAFACSLFYNARYACWGLIVSSAIAVSLNYLRPSSSVYNNAAHHIIALNAYERQGSLELVNFRKPESAIFDNKDFYGSVSASSKGGIILLKEKMSSHPLYAYDKQIGREGGYKLLNTQNLISFVENLSVINGEDTLFLNIKVKAGTVGFLHLSKQRDSLICKLSFNTSNNVRKDTSAFNKIIREGYPLIDIIRSAGQCSTSEEKLISILNKCQLLRDTIFSSSKDKLLSNARWYLTVPEELQTELSNKNYHIFADGKPFSYSIKEETFELSDGQRIYIGSGISKSSTISFSIGENDALAMKYDMPIMYNFPKDSIAYANKVAAISTSNDELTSNDIKEAFLFDLFKSPMNLNGFNGTIIYQTAPSPSPLSITILDDNSDKKNRAIDYSVNNKFQLSSKDKKGRWEVTVVDLRKESPITGRINNWLNEWLIIGVILVIAVFAFLTLYMFTDEDLMPTIKSVSVFHVWMFLLPMMTLRLYLLWRIAVFPPVSNISKAEFLRYRLENGSGLNNAMILTLCCIGIFAILTLLYFIYYKYVKGVSTFKWSLDVKRTKIIYATLLAIAFVALMTKMVIGNIAIPVLVFFVNEYLSLKKLSLPYRVLNTMLVIAFLVKGDPGYAIMFIIFACVYFIIQTIVFRNSGTSEGAQRNAAWKLCFVLSLVVGILVIFSPTFVSWLYSNNTIFGVPLPYWCFALVGIACAWIVVRIIAINYGRKTSLYVGIVSILGVLALTLFGPHYLDSNKHFKYRSLIHTQDVGQIMMEEDVADRDNQRLLEASQNQWFLQHHNNLGEERITDNGIIHLYPHFKKGVSWSTQISDVICSRYIIGELSLIVPLSIIAFIFVFFVFALRHRGGSPIGRSIAYGIALLLLIQTTFVWMANTNRMIFFGQDFPFMSQNAKATLLMFLLLLFIMMLACGNQTPDDEESKGVSLTEYGFEYFNKKPIKVFFVMFIAIFGIVFITGNKYSSLYGTHIATEFNPGEAMQQAEKDFAKINAILATYPATKPLKPHGENLTKTIDINKILGSVGLDQAVQKMESDHEISPFSASLYRAFRNNLQNDNRIDNIIHLRYLSASGSYIFGLNNGFYSLRAPEMKRTVWKGNVYACEVKDDTDHLLTSSNRANHIDIYRIPNSWLKEKGNFGIADVRYVKEDSKVLLHSFANDFTVSSGLFVVNGDEAIESKIGNNIYVDQLSGYKEKVLAKNMIVNGENKFFYPMGRDFYWIKDFSEMLSSQNHGTQNCYLSIDKELMGIVAEELNKVGRTCSVVALDGNGNVRLMAEHYETDEYNLDPNDIVSIENFVERSYLNPNFIEDSKLFGNQNLLYMLPGPGSSLKPITYAAVTSQVSPQIINWSSLKLHAPDPKYLSDGYYRLDQFGPTYRYSTKHPFKSISGDETGIDGWVDNSFYLYKSSNYYNALITYLGNYDKDELNSIKDIIEPTSDFSKYPVFQINGVNYGFKSAPSKRRQNYVLNTGLSINFKMNVSYDDADSIQFVDKKWLEGINPVNHPWVFPASSNAFMREMNEMDSEAQRLKQYTLGASPLRITPLMMAEMYGRLFSMHPDFYACITENGNPFTEKWDSPSSMDRMAMFNFYQKELFKGMNLCVKIGTASSPLQNVDTHEGQYHLYAKTGTLTMGNNIKDDRMLAVIISNKDILTASSPDSYKFYVVYFRFKQTGSMYSVSKIINDIISSKSFVSFMNN